MAAVLIAPGSILAEDHAAHHAGSAQTAPSGAAPAGMGGGEMGGMGEMMAPSPAPSASLYSELMTLPALTPEKRAELDRLAADQMRAGMAQLAAGSEALDRGMQASDDVATQAAIVRMREGLAEVDAGVAIRRALAEGKPPQNLALAWFRQQMNLAAPVPAEPRGLARLSVAHLFTMVLLSAFVLGMVVAYVVRMRRAATLLDAMAAPPAGGAPPATPEAPPANVPMSPPAVPTPAARASTGARPATCCCVVPASMADCCIVPLHPAPGAWKGKLRVASIIAETAVVKTYRLMATDAGPMPFRFAPGQYLNVTVDVSGARQMRCYTIASSPTQRDYVELTIKREEHGAVSRHLHDLVKVGDTIDCEGPNGTFVFTGQEADSIVLIAGGVGITPMMSIVRYLNDRSWPGEMFLVYACKSSRDFVFEAELAQLERRNAKLQVVATMERTEGTDWMGTRGRISQDLLVQSVPNLTSRRIHICGPPGMMDAVQAILKNLGIPRDHIKTEAFGAPGGPSKAPTTIGAVVTPPATAAATGDAPLVTFTRSNKMARIHDGKTVLELSEEIGVPIDFQCRVGVCGRCKVKLDSGEVEMQVQDALDDADKKQGIILACQAKPTTDVAIEA